MHVRLHKEEAKKLYKKVANNFLFLYLFLVETS